MAIVTKKKARRGRGGICAGLSPRTGAWALVGVLCVVAAAWWLVAGRTRGTEPTNQDEKAAGGQRQEVKRGLGVPAPSGQAIVHQDLEEPQEEPETPAEEAKHRADGLPDYVPDDYVKKPGQMMLPNGKVLTFPPPGEGEIRTVVGGGKTWECDGEGGWRDVTPRQLFKTAFEANFLGLSVEGRSFIPAFLTGLDQDAVVEMLKKDYVPVGDETEDELAQIAAYDEMRAIALDYIDQGGSFDDFVTEIASYERAQRKMHAASMKQVMTLFKEGRIDEAKARAAELDEVLAGQGYKPLRLPAHVRRAFGIEE